MNDTTIMMNYLYKLEINNEKEWFRKHKQERLVATTIFENHIQECVLMIQSFDSSIPLIDPKTLSFKMVRDTRFSSNKLPYHAAFRAHIGSRGKLPIPVGYYINIQPNGNTFIGGGLFSDMFKDATNMIRTYILDHGEEFKNILDQEEFKNTYSLLGSKLKNVPKGYDVQHPYSEFLKYKSWFIECHVNDEDVMREDFWDIFIEKCKIMKPFNDFLNKALCNFEMPQR